MKILDNTYINLTVRIVVGLVFIFFAVGKIVEPGKFAGEIANYKIMPEFSLNILAIILPWLELITGLFFLIGLKIRSSSILIISMLIVFNTLIIIAMVKGLNIYCGCSSVNPEKVGYPKLLKNFSMLAITIITVIYPVSKLSFDYYLQAKVNVE